MKYNINVKPETIEYYNEALDIIKKQGYIRATELTKIFHGAISRTIEDTFEREGEPLFDEKMLFPYYRKDGITVLGSYKVLKLLNPLFKQWRQEAKYDNGYITNYSYGSLNI